MNSNGNAPKKAGVKKKRPLKQRVALWLIEKIDGKGAKNKKAQPKHVVNTKRPPAVRQQNPGATRTADKTQTQKKINTRIAILKPVKKPVRKVTVKKASAKKPTGNISLKKVVQMYLRKLLKMKKKLYIGAGVAVVLLIMLILSRTVLFKIDNIVVQNPSDVSYTSEQISMETGIVSGTQNLFSCDLKKVEKNIEQRLPYIGDAVVERDFPSSLKVTVTPTSVSAAIVHGAGYILIDENGKMLEYTQAAPDAVPTLRTSVEISPDIGYYLGDTQRLEKGQETNDEAEMIRLYSEVREAAEKAGLIDGITLVDIRDARAITMMYENRLTLHLGNESMLETKLKTGAINLEKVGTAYAIDTVEDVTEPVTEA